HYRHVGTLRCRRGGRQPSHLSMVDTITHSITQAGQSDRTCVDVYGPRAIATACLVLERRSRLLTYIRLFERPDISSPRAPMGFRALLPQCPQDIGVSRAGPHIRFEKRSG